MLSLKSTNRRDRTTVSMSISEVVGTLDPTTFRCWPGLSQRASKNGSLAAVVVQNTSAATAASSAVATAVTSKSMGRLRGAELFGLVEVPAPDQRSLKLPDPRNRLEVGVRLLAVPEDRQRLGIRPRQDVSGGGGTNRGDLPPIHDHAGCAILGIEQNDEALMRAQLGAEVGRENGHDLDSEPLGTADVPGHHAQEPPTVRVNGPIWSSEEANATRP